MKIFPEEAVQSAPQSMEKRSFVTTSWDDGDRADLRLAELLRSREVVGTFYVPITPYQARPALGHGELRTLASEGFEIGRLFSYLFFQDGKTAWQETQLN